MIYNFSVHLKIIFAALADRKSRGTIEMKLVEFSVTNYRSITKAHKIELQNLTVLVGKNNEGKSNLLTALNVAMTAVIMHSQGEKSENSF